MTEKDVVLYTQPGCAECAQEKKWLSARGVAFTEKNVREDEQALQELMELGSQGIPTAVVDGEVVMGFDPGKLGEKLGV